jgi:hypothetical protein
MAGLETEHAEPGGPRAIAPWIPMELDLAVSTDVIAITAAVEQLVDEDHTVGKLHRFWAWANRQTADGNLPGVTEAWIDRYLGITGFAAALLKVGWLIELPAGGLAIADFGRWNGKSAKARLLNARRVSEHKSRTRRAKGNAGGNAEVTPDHYQKRDLQKEKEKEIQQQQSAADGEKGEKTPERPVETPEGLGTAPEPERPPEAGVRPRTDAAGPSGAAAEIAAKAIRLLVGSGLVAEADAAAIAGEPNAADLELVGRAIAITQDRKRRRPGVNNAAGLIRELIRRQAPWPPELAADRDAAARRKLKAEADAAKRETEKRDNERNLAEGRAVVAWMDTLPSDVVAECVNLAHASFQPFVQRMIKHPTHHHAGLRLLTALNLVDRGIEPPADLRPILERWRIAQSKASEAVA